MPRGSKEHSCNAIGRLIKDFCSCSEYGTWSPEMTSEKRRGPFLKSELTNMSAMKRRIMAIAKRKTRDVPELPKLCPQTPKNDTLTSNLINTTISSQNSTIRRNIDNFLLSRRMFALEEDLYEKPISCIKNSTCGENWSLSKAWRNNNLNFFERSPVLDSYRLVERNLCGLERIDEIPRTERKRRSKKIKEQLRYDKHIKRHLRIRVMLSLRMRRYMKRRLRKKQPVQNINVPPRKFLRGASVTSSFGTRSYRSVMTDKSGDGTVLFDVHEARNTTLELCHDYEDDLDTLDIALRAGNFRSGRLAVEGWWCGRAMPADGRTNNGALALHYAAARGCLDCVRLLTDTTPDTSANTAMDNDVTPVYLAAQEGHLAVLKYLVLEAGGRLDARARDGMLPIHAAAQTGCLDCVKWMIVDRGVDPNARDGDGATPLHFAASRGHLGTVRWLLRHGARRHLDRHGKSPINDAAENHHLECLNVLVAAGAAGAEGKQLSYKAMHSCACSPGEARCALSNCINAGSTRSPFYLHAPERERRASVQERRGSLPSNTGSLNSARSGPADGLYVNPMQRAAANTAMHHSSSGEESSGCSASDADTANSGGWFLHSNGNSQPAAAALYQRVRDLFHTRSPGPRVPAEGQEAPIMTVKAEIHGSSTEVLQEHSDSDSGAEATRRDHHYEDIYISKEEHPRRRSSSRDSGSHSRPGSAALIVDYTAKDNTDNSSKAYEEVSPASDAHTKSSIATKLAALTHKAHNFASRISSAAGSRRASVSDDAAVVQASASASSGVSSGGSSGDEAPPPPPPPLPPVVLEEPAIRPSELRGRLARRGSAASQASADDERPRAPNLVNKQPALPFVPPAFPHNAPDRLIKPSEYLKTITAPCKRDEGAAEARPPPPPPVPDAPPPPPQPPLVHQPLAAISSAELSAVRLRTPATKTLSAPPPARSVSLQCIPSAAEPYRTAKTDLIEELKMSKDITGIKKMKVERARRESLQDKETFTEFTKRFTAENFVDQGCLQVPERDAAGNVIPVWKRQMLARRAAEKARKDLEKELAGEAERRRAAAVPAWKRQLLQRREEAENRLRSSLYTPKVEENGNGHSEWRAYPSGTQRAVSIDNISLCYDTPVIHAQPVRAPSEAKLSTTDLCNGHSTTNGKHENEEEESAKIIPWRAQLRKTNSKLNLLE